MQSESYNSFCLLKHRLLMASEELPSSFDLIVVGTGLEESIIAAAASRNGHSVLHLDINSYYGSQWSSFSLDGMISWADSFTKEDPAHGEDISGVDCAKELLKNDEKFVRTINTYTESFENISHRWHIPDKHQEENGNTTEPEEISKACKIGDDKYQEESENTTEPEEANEESKLDGDKHQEQNDNTTETVEANIDSSDPDQRTKQGVPVETCEKPRPNPESPPLTQEYLMKQSKRFSLDLFPHLLFARGPMVELLIKSNISRYTEFKSVSRILTILNGKLENVPSSRSDVFSTKHINVIEKRLLMKFINFCVDYETQPEVYSAFSEKTFVEFLESQKLTENLKNFVMHSIAMVNDKTGCLEGLASTKKFLTSLGRFGNSPLLWPMYGSGEMPQAFCRLCAVFGGVYNLDRPVNGLITKGNDVVAIVSRGQRIDCKFLVINSQLCPQELKSSFKKVGTRRKICLLTESILPSPSEQLSFLSLSPKLTGSDNFILVHEVGYAGAVCPRGFHCLYFTMPISGSVHETDVIMTKASELVVKDAEKLVWEINFDIRSDIFDSTTGSGHLSNLFLCSGPTFEVDFDTGVLKAETIFKSIFPGEEFLPRAPDPDEIILGEYDEEQ